jgi:capsular polysaccharide biosynthesis protein
MSDQALDLRRSAQIVRRHKILVGTVATLGLLAGGAYAAVKPPVLTATALVVLPQAAQSAQGSTANGAPSSYMATQEVVATSNPVLSDALAHVRPAMSLDQLRSQVQVGSLTSYVISISAKSKAVTNAEATANAVADSYIGYISSPGSPVGQLSAHLLQSATSATGPAPPTTFAVNALIGTLLGALIGGIAALIISRSDRRLRKRDEIADSIGVPVLASVSVRHPSDSAGWTKLLDDYEPGDVDAWRLRKTLYQLGFAGLSTTEYRADSGSTLAMITLSSDRNALSLGPQLAIFAASLGIPTALVVGPQQDTNVTATLRAACAAQSSAKRSGNLRIAVSDDQHAGQFPGAALTIVVAVVDGKTPGVGDTMRTAATLLGVSAGAATAEQLARVAASAAADGRDIAGIIVADPDSADPTTGRLPQLTRPGQHRMPARVIGTATETR